MDYMPLIAVLIYACVVAWGLARQGTPEVRRRRVLRAKVMARKLTCPLCQSSLPAWDRSFHEYRGGEFVGIWGGKDGAPVGSIKFHCVRCNRSVRFWVHRDGSVVPHFAWLWDDCKQQVKDGWRGQSGAGQ